MRISDWSSDVCSSDLPQIHRPLFQDGSRFHAVRQIPSDVRLHIFDTELLIRHRECRRHVLRSEPGVQSTHEGGCYCSPANVAAAWLRDRKSVVKGKSVPVRVVLGSRRLIQKKKTIIQT